MTHTRYGGFGLSVSLIFVIWIVALTINGLPTTREPSLEEDLLTLLEYLRETQDPSLSQLSSYSPHASQQQSAAAGEDPRLFNRDWVEGLDARDALNREVSEGHNRPASIIVPADFDLDKIQRHRSHYGDVQQSGSFGGQNFNIFSFLTTQQVSFIFFFFYFCFFLFQIKICL